ncbi:uncharacterized protein [Diabrotica undecimpunctata]|uniref:uncharacterized protein n=1 Tax=Diabrotica undecimpunctata TaxID=50387 RepID=UPI003B640FA2
MAVVKTKVNTNHNKVVTGITTTTTVTDKCSLWLVIFTIITILIVVITGICVKLLMESYTASIILVSLICFEIVIGFSVLAILAWRRNKLAMNHTVVRRNGVIKYHPVQPTAPQDEGSWEYSNRTTLPA